MIKKALTLYYIDDFGEKQQFPSGKMPARLESYTYSSKRMGNAPTIQGTLTYPACLDSDWFDRSKYVKSYNVFVEYNGERYYIDQTPTSSKDNTAVTYKHELSFVSERIILEHTFFLDVVTPDTEPAYKDRARSNETKFQFYGNLFELVSRINDSLVYTGTGYTASISEELEARLDAEGKLDDTNEISFDAQTHYEVLQTMADTFEVSYYFNGHNIVVADYQNFISDPVEYGSEGGLLSVTKTNSNETIVDRITGLGGDTNIPYYYPNPTPYGTLDFETVGFDASLVQGISRGKLQSWYKSNEWEKKTFTYYKAGNGFSNGGKILSIVQEIYADQNIEGSDAFPSDMKTRGYFKFENIEYTGEEGQIVNFRFSFTCMERPQNRPFDVYSEGHPRIYGEWAEVETTFIQYNSKLYNYQFLEDGTYSFDIEAEFLTPYPYSTLKEDHRYVWNLKIEAVVDSSTPSDKWGWIDFKGEYVPYKDLGVILKNTKGISNGNKITINGITYVQPMSNLMPLIYFESDGKERFYNADKLGYHDKSVNPNIDISYVERYPDLDFDYPNPYRKLFPHEHKEDFDDIYPTIKDMYNSDDKSICEVVDVVFDDNDDDTLKCETDSTTESTEYNHPYFYMKIRKTAFGTDREQYNFNLFEQAIENTTMKICMTTGDCAGCEFEIKTWNPLESQETGAFVFRNPIHVDEDGNIVSGDHDKKILNPTSEEDLSSAMQDTSEGEVWLILSKENSTFSHVMPNKAYNAKPKAEDKFVITGITMPQAYIRDAEGRLEKELIMYMRKHNEEVFNFSAHFSRVYIAKNKNFFDTLNENSKVRLAYNGVEHDLYVTSYSCKADTNCLYDVNIELGEELKVKENTLVKMIKSASAISSNDASKKSSKAMRNANAAANAYTDSKINKIAKATGVIDDSEGSSSSSSTDTSSIQGEVSQLKESLNYYLRKDIDDNNGSNTFSAGSIKVNNNAAIYGKLGVQGRAGFGDSILLGSYLITPTDEGIKVTRIDNKPANIITTGDMSADTFHETTT